MQSLDNPCINPLDAVRTFMMIGGQSVKGFTSKQAGLYLGQQFEEFSEKIKLLAEAAPDALGRDALNNLCLLLEAWACRFKEGYYQAAITYADRAELLDADIDMAWVSLGAAFSTSTDAAAAFAHVAERNLAKYPNGAVLRDENGKIKKPEGWFPPNLTPFIAKDE